MDSNDPANPSSNIPGSVPLIPLPTSDFNQAAGTPLPVQGPVDQIIADIPQLPVSGVPTNNSQTASPFNASAPELTPLAEQAPVPNSWDQSSSQPLANPWDTPPQGQASVDPLSSQPNLDIPVSQTSPWPSSASTAADVPVAPTPASAEATNPFLQPQSGASFSIPQTPLPTPGVGVENIPNPTPANSPDPLNTAFNPTGGNTPSPFAAFQAPTDPQNLGISGNPQPAQSNLNPWGQPAAASPTPEASAPISTPEETGMNYIPTGPQNPALDQGQPGVTTDNAAIQDQTISSEPSSAPLDLSSLQNNPPGNPASVAPNSYAPEQPIESSSPSAAPSTPTMPTENAPTDLSHLIAGEDQPPTQPMGNIYAPPVVPDQTPGVAAPQTPTTQGGSTPPPEKHLNLTKVLLVAGIPVILVVAALSAYLILGVGKSAPEADTSLPVEQKEQTQAPLTNPPEQIVAPSPAVLEPPVTTLPSSAPQDVVLPTEPASSPATSPTSAMDKLKARQSASPSPTPGTAASESLPTN